MLSLAVCANISARETPNVILILVDDMGYSDVGCFGGEIPTPNIDKLAKSGNISIGRGYNKSAAYY